MKLSIIIPIYKTERFLIKCLDSVFSQPVENLEVIAVNDGSPDRLCNQILSDYELRYNNLRVINQPNKGVSCARNAALDVATGDYIMFLDSDDFLEPNLKLLLGEVENAGEPDFIIAGHNYISCSGATSTVILDDKFFDSTSGLINYLFGKEMGLCFTPWAKLYKRAVIEKYSCRFEPDLKRYEDAVFNCLFLENAQTALSVETVIYNYLYHVGNTNNQYGGEKQFADLKYFSSVLKPFMRKSFQGEDYKKAEAEFRRYFALLWIPQIYALYRSKEPKKLLWLRRIFAEAASYNSNWLEYYTYGVPKIIARVSSKSMLMCHLVLRTIFFADRVRKKIKISE